MEIHLSEGIDSFSAANAVIARIPHCATEAEVLETAALAVKHFSLQVFSFVIAVQIEGREHHRYLVGCDPHLYYCYLKNGWYAIDPFLSYARCNTHPLLASAISSSSEEQKHLMTMASNSGFRGGIIVPAPSSSSYLTSVLYLGTDEGPEQAKKSFSLYRNLMRALAMELLEWWNARQARVNMVNFALDQLDIELLNLVRDRATTHEAATSLGITASCAKKRYERILKKLKTSSKRRAMEKALASGLIKPR